ncbi:MAG: hypothetical protein ACREHG_01945 [Candidatus Saccharimonadales bacterium]
MDYTYNANGEMTSDAGRSLAWTAFGKAETITAGHYEVGLVYGVPSARPERKSRWREPCFSPESAAKPSAFC